MKTETKTFPLRVVLTVTTKRLLTSRRGQRDNGIGDLYDILNWMTEDNLFTHQLPRAALECKPWLLRWFPELAEADGMLAVLDMLLGQEKGNEDMAIESWLEEIRRLPGVKDAYDIPRIPRDDHDVKHALDELIEMVGPEKVIVVEMEGEET